MFVYKNMILRPICVCFFCLFVFSIRGNDSLLYVHEISNTIPYCEREEKIYKVNFTSGGVVKTYDLSKTGMRLVKIYVDEQREMFFCVGYVGRTYYVLKVFDKNMKLVKDLGFPSFSPQIVTFDPSGLRIFISWDNSGIEEGWCIEKIEKYGIETNYDFEPQTTILSAKDLEILRTSKEIILNVFSSVSATGDIIYTVAENPQKIYIYNAENYSLIRVISVLDLIGGREVFSFGVKDVKNGKALLIKNEKIVEEGKERYRYTWFIYDVNESKSYPEVVTNVYPEAVNLSQDGKLMFFTEKSKSTDDLKELNEITNLRIYNMEEGKEMTTVDVPSGRPIIKERDNNFYYITPGKIKIVGLEEKRIHGVITSSVKMIKSLNIPEGVIISE